MNHINMIYHNRFDDNMYIYNLILLLTRKCNFNCKYCNNTNDTCENVDIDIDYIRYVLNYFKNIDNIRLELSGGEPGIINNLNIVFDIFKIFNNIKYISILSNGTIRKRYFDLLYNYNYNIEYYEHIFIDSILNNNIVDLKETDKFKPNYVLVLDKNTIKIINKNFEKIYNNNIFMKYNIRLKYLTQISTQFNIEYLNDLKYFYNRIMNSININNYCYKSVKWHLNNVNKMLDINVINNSTDTIKCSKFSNLAFIDLENKKIGSCSMSTKDSLYYNINKKNIDMLLKNNLFCYTKFCKNCVNYNQEVDDIINYNTQIN